MERKREFDPRAPRTIADVGLVPDDIANHPHLARHHDRAERARMVGAGIIIEPDPRGGDGLYEPRWMRRVLASRLCLTIEKAS